MEIGFYFVENRQDGRKKMGGSNQVDISGTLILEAEKDFAQPFRRNFLSKSLLADFIILAVTASEVRSSKALPRNEALLWRLSGMCPVHTAPAFAGGLCGTCEDTKYSFHTSKINFP